MNLHEAVINVKERATFQEDMKCHYRIFRKWRVFTVGEFTS